MGLYNTQPNTQSYVASIYLANSGAPTHTSSGGWQHLGGGGGTDTWTLEADTRPTGVATQCDLTSGAARLVCRKTGMYYVDARIRFTSITDAKGVGIAIYKNGADVLRSVDTTGAAVAGSSQVNGLLYLEAGDYVEPFGFQNDSASEAYDTGSSFFNKISMAYIGPNGNFGPTHQFDASMYLANSGSPTHTSDGGWQKVADGGGTDTWTSEWDIRSDGSTVQVDTATNKRINIRRTGLYLVHACTAFTSLADGSAVGTGVYVNGTGRAHTTTLVGATSSTITPLTTVLSLTENDFVELYAFQSDTASEAYLTTSSHYNKLSISYVGPADQPAVDPLTSPCRASLYLNNSGAPTHTSNGGWQHVGAGGGTDSWTAEYDIRDSGLSAQVDTTTGTANITVRKSGVYMVTASVLFNSLGDQIQFGVAVGLNGTENIRDLRRQSAASGQSALACVAAPMVLIAGDVLTLMAFQNESVSEAYTTTVTYLNRLTATYIGSSS